MTYLEKEVSKRALSRKERKLRRRLRRAKDIVIETFVELLQGWLERLECDLADVDVVHQLRQDSSGRFVAAEPGLGEEDVKQQKVPSLESGIIKVVAMSYMASNLYFDKAVCSNS